MRYRIECAAADCLFGCWADNPGLIEAIASAHAERAGHEVLVHDEHPAASNGADHHATGQGGTGATERRPS